MTRPLPTVAVLLLAPLLFVPSGAAARVLPAEHPLLTLLADCRAARGREHRALLVVPVESSRGMPAEYRRPATGGEASAAEDLSVGEPGGGQGRGPVEVYNFGRSRVLLLAGEALTGGIRDRVLSRDVLLEPGRMSRAPAITGDRQARPPAGRGRSLTPAGVMSPDLVRFAALSGGPEEAVEAFLGDAGAILKLPLARESLVEMASAAAKTQAMEEYRAMFARIPDAGTRTVTRSGSVRRCGPRSARRSGRRRPSGPGPRSRCGARERRSARCWTVTSSTRSSSPTRTRRRSRPRRRRGPP